MDIEKELRAAIERLQRGEETDADAIAVFVKIAADALTNLRRVANAIERIADHLEEKDA